MAEIISGSITLTFSQTGTLSTPTISPFITDILISKGLMLIGKQVFDSSKDFLAHRLENDVRVLNDLIDLRGLPIYYQENDDQGIEYQDNDDQGILWQENT
jgi:hypothetical protein